MRKPQSTKWIGGKHFYLDDSDFSKREMQKTAERRRKDGMMARVVKAGPYRGNDPKLKNMRGKMYYILYTANKEKR
jgi:hypothetical protein